VFLRWGSHELFLRGWLRTEILLVSAARVARIIGMSHQCQQKVLIEGTPADKDLEDSDRKPKTQTCWQMLLKGCSKHAQGIHNEGLRSSVAWEQGIWREISRRAVLNTYITLPLAPGKTDSLALTIPPTVSVFRHSEVSVTWLHWRI
jgi:hypothetical protein